MFSKKSEQDKQKGKTKKRPKTRKEKIITFIKDIIFAVIVVFVIIKAFIVETSRVPTPSMENTILVGDFLFVNKFIYGASSLRNIPFTNVRLPYFSLPGFRDPERGDIIVFEYPGDRDQLEPTEILSYVKRCIGLPGDTVQIVDKLVFVNGKRVPVPNKIQYRDPNIVEPIGHDPWKRIFPKGSNWSRDNYGPLVVPYFGEVINLNKDNIEIFRTIINRDYEREVVKVVDTLIYIDGKIENTYTMKDDYYFMMGDNRDNSLDSRYWGFVPREKILGQPFMIFWSWNSDIPFSDIFRLLGSIRLSRIAKVVD
ncbi:MAG: signal peptidase I [Ignavibacteriales bacterium]|nr:signal peptidase I [Ignavibacteriales bacterium]